MADLSFLERSNPVQIVGGDEQFPADVIREFGQNKLRTKGEFEISSNLGIVANTTEIELVNDTEFELINVGPTTISGFTIRFNKDNPFIKLVVDDVEIFNIRMSDLRDVLDWNQAPLPSSYVSINSNRRVFYFAPNFPLRAFVSAKVFVTPTDNGTSVVAQVRQFS